MTNSNPATAGAEAGPSFSAGQKLFNRYKLDRVLGQGGMGVVWLARDEELDREIALKFLPTVVVNDRASLDDLKRETRRTLELTHPNIVRTYDFVQDATTAGISMEYVECDTLRNRKSDRPAQVFEPADLGDWVRQLCEALDYAHLHAAIVHRDLKPANLLVNARNQLKVADFGISRSLVESVTQVTGSRGSSGTLVYMSPQQLAGDRPHPLDDIYAVGATLYELCTRKPPFYSGDISGQIYGKEPASMAKQRALLGVPSGEIPENWETTVAACLAKDPAQRPRTAGEIAVRLGLKDASSLTQRDTVYAGPPTESGPIRVPRPGPSTATVPPPLPGPGFEPARRRSAVPLVLGIAAALVIGCVAVAWVVGGRIIGDQKSGASPRTSQPSGTTGLPRLQAPAPGPEPAPSANAPGGLFVETDPPGARVKVDDRPAEKTPVPLKDLPAGPHLLTVMLDGYEDFSTQVEVRPNQIVDTGKIRLVRSTGWLNVTTTPPGAEIYVKGPDTAETPLHFTTPWSSEKLPAGEYEIAFVRAGWQPFVRKVTLTRDQSVPIAMDLTGGSLEITSVPGKARVLLNGTEVGVTPYHPQDVQPGVAHYTLSAAGYQDLPVDVVVEPGKALKLERKLIKTASPTVAKAAPAHQAPPPVAHPRTTTRDDDDDRNRSSGSALDKAAKAMSIYRGFRGY